MTRNQIENDDPKSWYNESGLIAQETYVLRCTWIKALDL